MVPQRTKLAERSLIAVDRKVPRQARCKACRTRNTGVVRCVVVRFSGVRSNSYHRLVRGAASTPKWNRFPTESNPSSFLCLRSCRPTTHEVFSFAVCLNVRAWKKKPREYLPWAFSCAVQRLTISRTARNCATNPPDARASRRGEGGPKLREHRAV